MTDSLNLTPRPREKSLPERVAERIESLIFGNELLAGDRLPPERDLAAQFAVSRTVIREATRGLAAKGLVEIRTGSGTYVQAYTPQDAGQSLTFLLRRANSSHQLDARRIHEVRRPLEVEIAGHAAERATTDDLAELQTYIDAIEAPTLTLTEFVEADMMFHRVLARATQNDLFLVLLDSISDVLRAVRQVGFPVLGARESGIYHHKQIFARVAARDPEGARAAMAAHMDDSERISGTGGTAPGEPQTR